MQIRRRQWLAASLLALVLLGAAAEFLVPGLIRDAHRGVSLPALNRIFAGRQVHPAEHYLAVWQAMVRRAAVVLAGLWVLAAVLSRPAVTSRLAALLSPVPAGPGALEPRPPPRGRRRLVAAMAFAISAGSLTEIALDPPYRREHWPFSQYQMYSDLPKTTVVMRRLYGVVSGSGREIALSSKPYIAPFDHSRLWFSWDRIDRSSERESLLPIALRDCLDRYESRRVAGQHDGPRLEAGRLYLVHWTLDGRVSPSDTPKRELIWEVRTSTPPTPSR